MTPRPAYTPPTRAPERLSPCKRGCCWSPFGHSTVRDLPTWHRDRCTCHTESKGTPR